MTAAAVAWADLSGSLLRLPLALRLALEDINGKYRRTVLGPLWIAVGQAATIAGFVIVFSGLFQVAPENYALYLAAGFPVWAFISSFLNDMPASFINAKAFLETFDLPWLTYIWRRSIGYALVFFHQLVTLFIAMAFLGVVPSVNMLYAIPALVVILIGGTGVGLILAVFGARYRDLQPAMVVSSGVLFLFSPIVWRAEQLRVNEWAVHFNPIYYCMKLVRDPLLGIAPDWNVWLYTSLGSLAAFFLGFAIFIVSRRRLYHWL
ncbi:MAG: ABC transporter permease [Hyphomonadaceae bacterium]